jgi:hypothetical protein
LHAYIPGTYGAIDIAFPAYDWNGWEQQAADGNPCWTAASDATTLLTALDYVERAIDSPVYASSPGRTGAELLKWLHSGPHGLNLQPVTLPEAITRGVADGALIFRRLLTPEERGRQYLHAYDKHGQYLGAASSLALGFGEPEHLTGPDITFDAKLVGYWRARIAAPERPGLPPLAGSLGRFDWHPTDTIVYALGAGGTVEVSEAYVWRETHRPLEPWYKCLRDARTALSRPGRAYPNEAARRIALAALKHTYTRGLSWLAATAEGWDRSQDPLYRPDWYQFLIARARANLLRNIDKLPLETQPFMVGADCLYFTSDEPDPRRAIPPGLSLGDGLADYGVHDAAVPLGELLPLLDKPVEAVSVGEIQARLNRWRKESRQ